MPVNWPSPPALAAVALAGAAFAPPDPTAANTAETATSTAAAAASHHLRFKIFICCPSPPAGPEHRGRRPVTALSRLPLVGVRGGPGSYLPSARKRITEK